MGDSKISITPFGPPAPEMKIPPIPEPPKAKITLADAVKIAMAPLQQKLRAEAELLPNIAVGATAEEYEKLLKGYNEITAQPIIKGKDFTDLEDRFNTLPAVRAYKFFDAVDDDIYKYAPWINRAYETVLDAPHAKDVRDRLGELLEKKREEIRPDRIGSTGPDADLERKFIRQHPNMGTKKFSVPDSVTSEEGLIDALLAQGDGIVVAEYHTRSETLDFLTKHMARFKKGGVTTLDTEYPDRTVYKMDETALKKYIADLTLITDENKNRYSRAYNVPVELVDDMELAEAKMVLAAKQNHIRIFHFDKPFGPASDFELSPSHTRSRVSTTNFVMTDNIEDDKKLHPGKRIAVIGRWHVTPLVVTNAAETIPEQAKMQIFRNGLVAKALNMPVLAWESPRADSQAAFRKGGNPNGPDFYLIGRQGYDDSLNAYVPKIAPKEFDPIKELNKAHGLPAAIAKIPGAKLAGR